MMEKAIKFNPLDKSETFIECESDFTIKDEMYLHTSVGKFCLVGEVWKDTPKNRHLIERIIRKKQAIKRYTNIIKQEIIQLFNEREK